MINKQMLKRKKNLNVKNDFAVEGKVVIISDRMRLEKPKKSISISDNQSKNIIYPQTKDDKN